ncbi:MAG: XTP/dITP diphosphatase [Halanaerobiales bacterium]
MKKLLIASGNSGKVDELKSMLGDLPFELMSRQDFPDLPEVEEDGESFRENALKKARVSASKSGLLTLADDSGLEVDHLKGRPGIHSSRYSGENADDKDNNQKLLEELKDVRDYRRTARFRCVMALVDPQNDFETTREGTCEGYILEEPRGDNGFGYDPLFLIPSYGKTLAELEQKEKNKISHRADAVKLMRKVLIERYTEQKEYL